MRLNIIKADDTETLPGTIPEAPPNTTPVIPAQPQPGRREEFDPVVPQSPCKPRPGKAPDENLLRGQLSRMARV